MSLWQDKEEKGGVEEREETMNGTRKVYGDVYDVLPLSGAKTYDAKTYDSNDSKQVCCCRLLQAVAGCVLRCVLRCVLL